MFINKDLITTLRAGKFAVKRRGKRSNLRYHWQGKNFEGSYKSSQEGSTFFVVIIKSVSCPTPIDYWLAYKIRNPSPPKKPRKRSLKQMDNPGWNTGNKVKQDNSPGKITTLLVLGPKPCSNLFRTLGERERGWNPYLRKDVVPEGGGCSTLLWSHKLTALNKRTWNALTLLESSGQTETIGNKWSFRYQALCHMGDCASSWRSMNQNKCKCFWLQKLSIMEKNLGAVWG